MSIAAVLGGARYQIDRLETPPSELPLDKLGVTKRDQIDRLETPPSELPLDKLEVIKRDQSIASEPTLELRSTVEDD